MRRGLLTRCEAEVPAGELAERLARLRERAKKSGFAAVLLYTNFSRPAAVSYHTHFVPYWSHGVLVVPMDRPSVFVAGLSRRVEGWMREAGSLERIECVADIGKGVVDALAGSGCSEALVGAAPLADMPQAVIASIRNALPRARLADAGDLVRSAMSGHNAIAESLRRKAIDIAQYALAHASSAAGNANAMAAAIELAARSRGAEEVLTTFAPDLQDDPRMRRLEGRVALGERHAVQVGLAYKGHWVRLGRSVAARGAPAEWRAADAALLDVATQMRAAEDAAHVMRRWLAQRFPGIEAWWVVESCGLGSPFATLATSDGYATTATLAAGQPVVVTVRLKLRDGAWFGCTTATVGEGTEQDQRSET